MYYINFINILYVSINTPILYYIIINIINYDYVKLYNYKYKYIYNIFI